MIPHRKIYKNRLTKSRTEFYKLRSIWKPKQYNRKTKVKLYDSKVISVLLYAITRKFKSYLCF